MTMTFCLDFLNILLMKCVEKLYSLGFSMRIDLIETEIENMIR